MSIKYSDSGFLDGADETKKLSFDVSGVTTGTTRTITMPDGDTKLYTGDGTSGQILTSGGTGVAPTFQTSTHTPDDNSVTLAKMAHGTDGELITYDATGAPANVAVGTSGQVLTSGGAGVAPTFQTAAGGGKVLQVVSTTKTDTFTYVHSTANSPETFADVTGLSVTITPSATSSKILVFVNAVVAAGVQTQWMSVFRGSTNLAVPDSPSGRTPAFTGDFRVASQSTTVSISYLDSPNTTSATTYQVKAAGWAAGTLYINRCIDDANGGYRSRGVSTITVMEIGA